MKKNIYTLIAALLLSGSTQVMALSTTKTIYSKKTTRSHTGLAKIKKDKVKKTFSMAELTRNIEYSFAKSSVRDAYFDKLDQLAKTMIDNKYAVTLRGHADSIGTFKGNWVISDKRAKAVKSYLVDKGVDESKIITTPFGSTKPIASNKTKEGRQKNRRVEIKLNEIKE